ncbi:hypothetical protein DPMN_146495 [Dreissena polymorpha]|uniref:Uncharacterized protein n=1 Tax=Dreissena polymorpha TaxID=45954 RepID=A0A9D4J253_DREPO|nr:hypothetical protein DPMN_146495 [Dreissena polymorpha]
MIVKKCTPFVCRQECLEFRKELQKDPCFHSEVQSLYRSWGLLNPQIKSQMTNFFAALDSCDWEMWQAGYGPFGGGHTSGVAVSVATVMTSVLVPLVSAMYL